MSKPIEADQTGTDCSTKTPSRKALLGFLAPHPKEAHANKILTVQNALQEGFVA